MRSMMLRNPHVRAVDRFFDTAIGNGFDSPFAVMDRVLDSITKPIPPENGSEFTLYKMIPVTYKVEYQDDGSVHYNVIGGEQAETDDKPETE